MEITLQKLDSWEKNRTSKERKLFNQTSLSIVSQIFCSVSQLEENNPQAVSCDTDIDQKCFEKSGQNIGLHGLNQEHPHICNLNNIHFFSTSFPNMDLVCGGQKSQEELERCKAIKFVQSSEVGWENVQRISRGQMGNNVGCWATEL